MSAIVNTSMSRKSFSPTIAPQQKEVDKLLSVFNVTCHQLTPVKPNSNPKTSVDLIKCEDTDMEDFQCSKKKKKRKKQKDNDDDEVTYDSPSKRRRVVDVHGGAERELTHTEPDPDNNLENRAAGPEPHTDTAPRKHKKKKHKHSQRDDDETFESSQDTVFHAERQKKKHKKNKHKEKHCTSSPTGTETENPTDHGTNTETKNPSDSVTDNTETQSSYIRPSGTVGQIASTQSLGDGDGLDTQQSLFTDIEFTRHAVKHKHSSQDDVVHPHTTQKDLAQPRSDVDSSQHTDVPTTIREESARETKQRVRFDVEQEAETETPHKKQKKKKKRKDKEHRTSSPMGTEMENPTDHGTNTETKNPSDSVTDNTETQSSYIRPSGTVGQIASTQSLGDGDGLDTQQSLFTDIEFTRHAVKHKHSSQDDVVHPHTTQKSKTENLEQVYKIDSTSLEDRAEPRSDADSSQHTNVPETIREESAHERNRRVRFDVEQEAETETPHKKQKKKKKQKDKVKEAPSDEDLSQAADSPRDSQPTSQHLDAAEHHPEKKKQKKKKKHKEKRRGEGDGEDLDQQQMERTNRNDNGEFTPGDSEDSSDIRLSGRVRATPQESYSSSLDTTGLFSSQEYLYTEQDRDVYPNVQPPMESSRDTENVSQLTDNVQEAAVRDSNQGQGEVSELDSARDSDSDSDSSQSLITPAAITTDMSHNALSATDNTVNAAVGDSQQRAGGVDGTSDTEEGDRDFETSDVNVGTDVTAGTDVNATTVTRKKGSIRGAKHWTKKEDAQLTKNWNRFITDNPIVENPLCLLFKKLGENEFNLKKKKKKTNFYHMLGENLERSEQAAFKRAQRLFHPDRTTVLLPEDVEIAEDLAGLGQGWANISEEFSVTAQRTHDAVRARNRDKQSVTKGRWSQAEDTQLAAAVREVCGKADQLENVSWEQVALLVEGRNDKQCCYRWTFTLYWKEVHGRPRQPFLPVHQVQLINAIAALGASDEADLDWSKLKKKVHTDIPSAFWLKKEWLALKAKYPGSKNQQGKLTRTYLEEFRRAVSKGRLLKNIRGRKPKEKAQGHPKDRPQ